MTPGTRQMISTLDVQWHEFFSERAGILEYECKLPREEAENLAFRETTSAMLKARIADISHRPRALAVPTHEPVLDRKMAAAGELE